MTSLFIPLFLAGLVFAAEPGSSTKNEQEIRKTVEAYVQAYNLGDGAALASHWSRKGEFVSAFGERLKGRDKIKPALEKFLQDNKGIQLKVALYNVEFKSPDRAVSNGIALVERKGDEPEETHFTATFVKEEGNWKLSSIDEEESSVPFATIAQLGQLEWLMGDWVDKDEDATVETSFRWAKNYGFINGTFRVIVDGKLDVEGTQVIGWDPAAKTIRSWIFDSNGGFAEGVWSGNENRWTIKLKSILPDGRKASSVNVYTYVDPGSFTWQSTGREVNGEPLPNIDPVTVVRKEIHSAVSGAAR
jgi:uncharacterized protein (TIGR02246 family)